MSKIKKGHFRIGMTSYNIKKIGNKLDTITKRVEYPDPELKRIGKAMVTKTQEAFKQQKDITTMRKWTKLAKGTRPRRKENKAPNSKMLRDTKALINSLKTYDLHHKSGTSTYKVELKTDVYYAQWQNQGTKGRTTYKKAQKQGAKAGNPNNREKGKVHQIPARRFASHSKQDVKRYKEGLINYIKKK